MKVHNVYYNESHQYLSSARVTTITTLHIQKTHDTKQTQNTSTQQITKSTEHVTSNTQQITHTTT